MRITLFLAGLALAGAAAATEPGDSTTRMAGNVEVTEAVEGNLYALGGNVAVQAPVSGNVRAVGGYVTINGTVGGDASIVAGTLELGPEARIAGKLSFHGGEMRRDPAAEVTGPVTESTGRKRHKVEFAGPLERHGHAGWIWTAGLVVLAALIAAALPEPSSRMARELRERPWLTTLVGLVALTTIPVAAVLLLVTIIGIPLGLLAMAGYAALLLVGYVWLAVVVGGLLLDRVRPEVAAATAWRAGAAVVAMLAIALAARIPVVGGLVILSALVLGVGMIVAAVMRRKMPLSPSEPALI
jgi:cytoskeletal protein CcmA (bactofilin family)